MARVSDLPSLSVRRPVLVVVINLLIVIAGLAAVLGVEVRELPDVDRPVVMVRAFFDGASPETMDAEVTSVIEGAVARVSGVKTINAASEEKQCTDTRRVCAKRRSRRRRQRCSRGRRGDRTGPARRCRRRHDR